MPLTQDEKKQFMDTLKSFMIGDLEMSHKISSSKCLADVLLVEIQAI
jgi:hypothetical protein